MCIHLVLYLKVQDTFKGKNLIENIDTEIIGAFHDTLLGLLDQDYTKEQLRKIVEAALQAEHN